MTIIALDSEVREKERKIRQEEENKIYATNSMTVCKVRKREGKEKKKEKKKVSKNNLKIRLF